MEKGKLYFFHILVRMRPGSEFSNAEIKRRFRLYYGNDDKRELEELRMAQILALTEFFANLILVLISRKKPG